MTKLTVIIALFLNVFAFGQSINILDAVAENKIEYNASGSWNSLDKMEFIDANGQYFGKCMTLEIQSITNETLELEIKNGLMLMCEDTSIQDMIITKPTYVTLLPNQNKTIKLYAMCSELHNGMPFEGIVYTIGEMADKKLIAITQTIGNMFMQNIVGQGAVWAYTDNATEEDLRLYGATSTSLPLTIEILNKAGVITNINPQSEVEIIQEDAKETKTEDNSDNIIKLNAYLVYGCIGLILLLVVLLLKKRKNNNQQA